MSKTKNEWDRLNNIMPNIAQSMIQEAIRAGRSEDVIRLFELFGIKDDYPTIIATLEEKVALLKEKNKNMRLTAEDKKLIALIDAWYFMTVEDIKIFMKYNDASTARWRLKRLIQNGFINRYKSPFGIYIYILKDDFKGLNLATFEHEQTIKNIAVKLSENYNCEYITIHQMRKEAQQEQDIAGLTKKIPDLVLVKDGNHIAVELELTQKNLRRQTENIDRYISLLAKKEFVQVVYYCGTETIFNRLTKIIIEKGVQQRILVEMLDENLRYNL